jgi:hypothetical protein
MAVRLKKVCEQCGEPRRGRRFCSGACYHKWRVDNPGLIGKTGPKPSAATCGHNARHHANGLCAICYRRGKARGYYPTRGRDQHFKRSYGLTREQVEAAIAARSNRCDICGRLAKLHVDHDHAAKKVRGFLCGSCNRGLGLFRDSPISLARAVTYLERAA